MRSLRLKNFRSFVDTGRIELRPLTILVGANGSGKSSFLRFFPLLRQTHEKQGPSPLAWFGRYVDFGDFSQTLHRGAEPREMTVELEQHIESSQPSTASLPWILPTRIVSSTTLSEQDGSAGVRSYVLARDGGLARFAFESLGESVDLRARRHAHQLAYRLLRPLSHAPCPERPYPRRAVSRPHDTRAQGCAVQLGARALRGKAYRLRFRGVAWQAR